MPDSSRPVFWGMLALAVALVVAAAIGADALRDVKRAGDTIDVKGSARLRVASDHVVWRGSIDFFAVDLGAGMRNLVAHRGRVAGWLAAQGLADSLVAWRPPTQWAQMERGEQGQPTGRVLGYQLRQEFAVRGRDLDRVERAAAGVETLMLEGLPLQPQPLEYTYTRLDEARVALMGRATEDARQRAQQIAEAAGGAIGPIRSARMGVIQVVAPQSTNVSSMGVYDTTTRDKDVVAVVQAIFGVE